LPVRLAKADDADGAAPKSLPGTEPKPVELKGAPKK
jgi:hypothetical protein